MSCKECHSHEHKEKKSLLTIVIIAVSIVMILVSFLPFLADDFSKLMLILAADICGIPIFIDAVKSLKKKQITESFLLVVAVIASFFLGEFFEAAVVSVLFRIGELMENYVSDKSRKSIESIFGIISDEANLVKSDGTLKKIDAENIRIGDILAVLPHEIVPVDGEVINGKGSVDASALTGESMPVEVCEGSTVSSGMINGDSTLRIRASAEKENSSAARIVEMVEQAAQKKGRAQRAVTVFAKYYTPSIIAVAAVIAVVPFM